ncbi:MAG: PDZ domain-containing protein, partial [Clostridia bacterium]|nr:PDZ domain-containing protein [Clostridia bacterium]
MINKYINRLAAFIAATVLLLSPISASTPESVCPGGFPFGVKMYTDGVIVSALEEVNTENGTVMPGVNAGLKIKDIITEADGEKLTSAVTLSEMILHSDGSPLSLTVKRDGETITLSLIPAKCSFDGKFKAGMWLKDSTAGVGTVTYVIPETGEFAGLGHGICDVDTGNPLPLARGIVSGVSVSGIKKGSPGSPGELRASFMGGKVGILTDNRSTGVYGILSERPSLKQVKLGTREDICEGKAYIISTLDNSGAKEYEVELSDINKSSTGSKSFVVTVTDKALLEKTGGIVQG